MSRRSRRNAASRRGEPEIKRIARRALAVGTAKGAWPALLQMVADPVRYVGNLAQIVVYLTPWEEFLRLDRDPSRRIRLAAATAHALDYEGNASNLGLPVHRFGDPAVYSEWQRRCADMRPLMERLARDSDPEVRATAARSPWIARPHLGAC